MTVLLNRRRLLKSAPSLLTVATLGAFASRNAQATPQRAPEDAARVQHPAYASIDQCLQLAVDDGTVTGVVAMGATERGLVYEGARGWANLHTRDALSPDTIVWLLSMTKAITATACMQLVEQGRLRLDQPAGEILPQLRSPRILDGFDTSGQPKLRPARNTITVRHLLTHTSGLTYSIWSDEISQYEKVTGMPDIGYSMNGAFAAPLEFEPGERWEYGISMDWVGKLVEALTDQSLEVYFREHIFKPPGMRNTGFLIGSAQKARVATMYRRQADGSLVPEPFEINKSPAPGRHNFATRRPLFTHARSIERCMQLPESQARSAAYLPAIFSPRVSRCARWCATPRGQRYGRSAAANSRRRAWKTLRRSPPLSKAQRAFSFCRLRISIRRPGFPKRAS